jgi:hypothetical protein
MASTMRRMPLWMWSRVSGKVVRIVPSSLADSAMTLGCLDLADRNDRRMHGVGLARNQRLQRRYQQRRDYDRIDRLVWTCTVSAFATDGDVETVAGPSSRLCGS